MVKILALDPSGTGTTGVCLINQKITFQEFKSKIWQDHLNFLRLLIAKKEPNLLLYENTHYLHTKTKDSLSLFRLLGAIEGLPVKTEPILVNQVKELKSKLFKGQAKIKDLEFKLGRGWFYQAKKLSLHQLDAWLVYWLWKEKHE